MCECLKFEPNKWKIKSPTFTPNTVIKSTPSPKTNINEAMSMALTAIERREKMRISIGCVLKIVSGVRETAEWWTLWNAHRQGTLCNIQCTIYFVTSSKIKRHSVKKVITSAGLKSNEGRNGITAWSHSKTANVATVLDSHAFAIKTENSLLRKNRR